MKKFIGAVLAVVLLVAPAYAFAQTSTTTSASVQSLLNQIKALQTQIAALKALQEQMIKAQGEIVSSLKLLRDLKEGMSGDDIKALQAILAADPSIYPEGLITGFYGRLTSEAVKKFQKKHGIEMLGLVGPKTLRKLNEERERLGLNFRDDDDDEDNDGDRKDKVLCAKIPPGHLIAPGWLKKNNKPIVPECQVLPYGIAKKLATTTVATSTPDTIPPIISGVATSNLLATTTNVVWTTNEKATSKVWFSTTTPVVIESASSVSSSEKVKGHNLSLSGLATSTIYYYVVGSTDSSGNTATSSQYSFTTLAN